MAIAVYATILDQDMPPRDRSYRCAFISGSLEGARARRRWNGNKRQCNLANWKESPVERISVRHVMTGHQYEAHIYRLEACSD